MPIEKQPFKTYKLDDSKDRDIISVSLNEKEREVLEYIKSKINVKEDAKAVKKAMFLGKNVIHHYLTDDFLKGLFIKKVSKWHKNWRELSES